MIADLTCWGWGKKPVKHKVRWVQIHSGSVGTPRHLPWGRASASLAGGLRNESGGTLGALMVCDTSQDMTAASHISAVEPGMPIRRDENPQDLSQVEVWGELYS